MKKQVLKWCGKLSCGIVVAVSLIITLLGIVLYNASRWVMETWGLLSIDEIIFHLKVPLEGTNEEVIVDFLNRCIPSAVLVVLTIGVLLVVSRKNKKMWIPIISASILASALSAYNGGVYVWNKLGVTEYMANQTEDSKFIMENYVDPRATEIVFPEQKRNLIYIFLESMEGTFMSKDVGGAFDTNYIPELTQLAQDNVSFSGNGSLSGLNAATGATWTMGAMFAHTTGLPLKIPINKNEMDKQEVFFPDVATLGDVLNREGYNQMLMVGSDATFGGRRNYFEQHGDYEIWDYNTAIETEKIPADYRVWWGYEDQKLFHYAKEELAALSSRPEPFNFTLLTVDTHFEDGYVCELCGNANNNQYADVMSCSSRQIYEFINWILQQDFYENTTIVLVGDHLTMDKDFCANIDSGYERMVYNTFINAAQDPEIGTGRAGATIDLFPTTLASLGAQIKGNKLGLGVNLFSAEQTLTERYGAEVLNEKLEQKSEFYDCFIKDIVVESVADAN